MTTFLRLFRETGTLWRWWCLMLLLATIAPVIAIGLPLVERHLIDNVILAGRRDRLLETVALYAALWLLSAAVLVAGGLLRAYLGERLALHLRARLFAHCEALSVAFARREHSGRTTSLFVNDVPSVTGLVSSTILTGVGSLIALTLGAVVMFRLEPALALAGAVAPLVVAGAAALVTRPLRPAVRRAQAKTAELTQKIQENLTGLREIIAFGQERRQAARLGGTLQELLRLRMRVAGIESAIGVGASLFSLTVTVTIFVYGSYLVIEGSTTLGTMIAMQSLFGMLFQPAGQMVSLFTSAQKALGAADRIYAFLDEPPSVEDDGELAPEAIDGEVVFDGVGFGYRDGEPVLRDVSFHAPPGALVALVGPSGAGKTTITSLLARFYDPDEGQILIDGHDLRDLRLDALRDAVGFVFQDTFLFDGTIRENVAFGQPEASDDSVIAAARAAQAWEFIERLPLGLETPVGERGMQLSEGQKQRIAIARVILRDPRILILDEPTSALDARSEALLREAMAALTRRRTTFVIAHRLATVANADLILVVEGGRIIERGRHADLIRRGGLYRELCALQFGDVAGLGAELARGEQPAAVLP